MTGTTKTTVFAVAAISALAGLLFAGCASRNYPGPVHGPAFDGTVQSIDLPNHLLTLAPLKPGPPAIFAYYSSTKFWQNGVPIRPADVVLGKSIRVHYHTASGQPVAHHVYVQEPYAPQH